MAVAVAVQMAIVVAVVVMVIAAAVVAIMIGVAAAVVATLVTLACFKSRGGLRGTARMLRAFEPRLQGVRRRWPMEHHDPAVRT
jgi:hypothetical protein